MALEVLDEERVFDWLPDLDVATWKALAVPAQRADYARTRLIYRYGGLWVDADCIAMAPLAELTDLLADHELVSWGGDVQGRFFNNLFAARPGAAFVARWIEEQDRALASSDDWSRLPWAALGSDPVYPFVLDEDYVNVPAARVAPVLWFGWRRFLSPFQSPARVLAESPVTVMLWNKGMGPKLAGRSAEQLRSSPMLLARLLRIALGTSTLDDELDLLTRLAPVSDLRYGRIGRATERRVRRALGLPAATGWDGAGDERARPAQRRRARAVMTPTTRSRSSSARRGAARQAQARGRRCRRPTGAAEHRRLGEHRLEVQGLPRRPGLDVVRLEGQRGPASRSAPKRVGVDQDAGEPVVGLAVGRDGHEADARRGRRARPGRPR